MYKIRNTNPIGIGFRLQPLLEIGSQLKVAAGGDLIIIVVAIVLTESPL